MSGPVSAVAPVTDSLPPLNRAPVFRTTVRIETRWSPQRGVAGLLERLFAPRMIGKVYDEELRKLEAYAARRAAAG